MQAHKVDGSLYPVLVVKGDIPDQFFEILDGISHATQEYNGETYNTFPFWHIDRLTRFFGEPQNDYGRQLLDSVRKQQAEIDAVKAGTHPLLRNAPHYFYGHQKKAWALAVICRTFGFFLDPGLGKTAVMIELMRIRQRRTPTLVIMPATLVQSTWIPELRQWGPELTYINLQDSPELASQYADVYLLNREKLARNPEYYYQSLRHRIGRIIIDESSMMKDPETSTAEALHKYFGTVPERYLLSGTPAPNGPHEYWAQIHLIRPGLLPVRYAEYMKEYFSQKHRNKYQIKAGCMEIVMERISSCSISMRKEDCLDLPEKRFIEKWVKLPDTAECPCREAYNQLKAKLRQEIFQLKEKGHQGGSMFAQIMKLREITSGFIVTYYFEPGMDNKTGLPTKIRKSRWNFVSKHKYDILAELLEEIGNRQVVIWMNFIEDFKMLYQLFPHLKEKIGYIYGEVTSQEVRANTINLFRTGRLQYIAANPASLGHGVTLINPANPCSDVIYFDLDYSLEKFEQSQDRVHRIGQTRSVNYYSILCEDTIDEAIWSRLKAKKEVLSEAMEYLR